MMHRIGLFVVLGILYGWLLVASSQATPASSPETGSSTTLHSSAISENLLQNPGFEDNLNDWWYAGDLAGVTTEIDTSIAHSGSKSLRIIFDGTQNVDYYQVGQDVVVEPNTTYILQAYMRVSGMQDYHGVALLVQDTRGWDYFGYPTPDMYTTQDWTRVSTIPFTTLVDTASIAVIVARTNRDWNSTISGTAWIDDVSLFKLPPQISPSTLTLRTGEVQTVTAISGAEQFTWTSDNNAVATVNKTGTRQASVMAVSPGEATVRAADGNGETGVLTLKVIQRSSITINAGNVIREVPEAMFGSNLNYTNGYPWTVWGDASPAYIADAANLGVSFMRFPGGTDSNYYDFSLGKGWIDWIGGPDQYNMTGYSTADFIEFLNATGIPGAMITANVYKSGNKYWPEDNWISCQVAADWVNDTNNILDFFVEYWELGNEIFYNGQSQAGEPQVPELTQALYIQKIHECSQLMKAVDSTIKIGASLQLPGKGSAEEWWDLPIIQQSADDIDFVIVHPYANVETTYLVNGNIVDSTATNIYSWFWSTHPIADLRQWLNIYAPGHNIEIQASEWDVYMHDLLPQGYDTLLSAVLNTDLFWDMVQEGADGANNWSFDMTLGVDGEGTYKFAQYYMLRMNRQCSGKWLVESQVTAPTYTGIPFGNDTYGLMLYGSVDGVPYLSSYATLSDDGNHLYLIVTNKSGEPQTTTINLNGFIPKNQASIWQMTSARWDDTGITPLASTIGHAASTFTYTFPARSVTSIIFDTQTMAGTEIYLPLILRGP